MKNPAKVFLAAIAATMTLTGCSDWLLTGAAVAGVAAVGYWITDPTAPNWSVQMEPVADDVYRIDLKMKNFTTGGAGEARQVFQTAAQRMTQQEKSIGYEILSYEEGINTEFLGGRRYAMGVIRLQRSASDPAQAWLDKRVN